MLKDEVKNSLIINNAIDLGADISDEKNGKGRSFTSRFIESGLAHYQEFGDVLITKETLDKFIHTMVGCPVIIKHKDITDKNVDKERVGVISEVWYNPQDGWYYCKGIIWDKQAISLVKDSGWSVSCTYDFESDFKKGTYHGKEYDMEFINGNFLHLALVPNPRYEKATIVVNAKDEEMKVEDEKMIENAKDWDGNDGEWITVKGNHLFIKKGQSKEEVVKEFIDKQEDKKTETKKDESKDKHGFKKDKDSGYYIKDLSDGTSIYVEKKKGEQGEKEPFFLEATHFDENGKTLLKKQYHYDSMDGMFDKIDKDFVSKEKETKPKEKKGKIDENLAKDALEQLFSKPFVLQEDEDRFKGAGFEHINADDIAEATDDEHWGDIESSLEFLKKREKAKAKEQKIKAKEQEASRKQDALRYGLKSMLKKISPYADFSYDADEKELEVRYFGDWEGDDGSGDYDWQTPTEKTVEKIKKIKKAFKKEYGFELESDWGEKNYFYFKVKDNKKAKNSLEDTFCEALAEIIIEE